jgi:hypothetical protein
MYQPVTSIVLPFTEGLLESVATSQAARIACSNSSRVTGLSSFLVEVLAIRDLPRS